MIKHPRVLIFSLFLGSLGLFYYANFRIETTFFDVIPVFSLLQVFETPVVLPAWFDEWFPSFIYLIGMSTFTLALVGVTQRTRLRIPSLWLVLSLCFEILQFGEGNTLLALGNFEWVDVLALFAAYLTLVAYFKFQSFGNSNFSGSTDRQRKGWIEGGILITGITLCLGSYKLNCTYPDDETRSCNVKPIYMSWAEIRDEDLFISLETNNPALLDKIDAGGNAVVGYNIENFGKIYAVDGGLFIVDQFRGVYAFDNKDPEKPRFEFFFEVNGATDVELKNNVLYVNSFMDIVSLSLDEFVFSRSKNVLPYPNVDLWLPNRVDFATDSGSTITIDQNKGVVIGYETDDGKVFYFWDLPL